MTTIQSHVSVSAVTLGVYNAKDVLAFLDTVKPVSRKIRGVRAVCLAAIDGRSTLSVYGSDWRASTILGRCDGYTGSVHVDADALAAAIELSGGACISWDDDGPVRIGDLEIPRQSPTFRVRYGMDTWSSGISWGARVHEVDFARFMPSMAFALDAAAKDDTRYAIKSVLVEAGKNGATFVGTDGRRLHVAEAPTRSAFDRVMDDGKLLIPADVAKLLVRVAKKGPRPVQFGSSDRIRVADFGPKLSIGWDALELRFPEWNMVVPRKFTVECSVDAKELAAAVKSAGKLCSKDFRCVTIDVGKDSIRVWPKGGPMPVSGTTVVEAHVVGSDVRICANPDYLVQALEGCRKNSPTGGVRISIEDDRGPFMVSSVERRSIIMPIASQ